MPYATERPDLWPTGSAYHTTQDVKYKCGTYTWPLFFLLSVCCQMYTLSNQALRKKKVDGFQTKDHQRAKKHKTNKMLLPCLSYLDF